MDNNQNTEQPSVMRRFMPLMIFAVLAVFLVIGLNNVETVRDVPSPLIGKPAPEFDLPLLLQDGRFSNQDLTGQMTLVNVWASWCFACRQEHEAVKYLARNGVRVIGLNYKDETDDAKNWLARQVANSETLMAAKEFSYQAGPSPRRRPHAGSPVPVDSDRRSAGRA